MHSLFDAKRAEVPLSVRVVTVEQQRGVYAGPGIQQAKPVSQVRPPRVRSAEQVRLPQVDDAERVVHRQHSPDAGQGVARLTSAGRAVRQADDVEQEALLHNRSLN